MSVRFHQSDLLAIVSIVRRLPQFRNVRDRQRFIDLALGGSPASERVIYALDLDGDPESCAVEVITKLSQFGQVEYGKEAVGVFLNGVLGAVGPDDSTILRELFARYTLGGLIAPQPTITARPKDFVSFTQEKVIGENTMFPVNVIQLALKAARSVVHLTVGPWFSTGFLVSEEMVMTNHHNLASDGDAGGMTVTFDYQLGTDGKPCKTTEMNVTKSGLLWTNPELDYAVLQLPTPAPAPPLTLGGTLPTPGDPVSVIQHPEGHLKQVSLRNNAVQHADSHRILYTTSTKRGASGAPLFAHSSFDVVGLHHGGGELLEAPSETTDYCNEAISISAVLEDLRQRCRSVYDRITNQ